MTGRGVVWAGIGCLWGLMACTPAGDEAGAGGADAAVVDAGAVEADAAVDAARAVDAAPSGPPAVIHVRPETLEIEIGGSATLGAVVLDADGRFAEATTRWSSSDPEIVEIGEAVEGRHRRRVHARRLGEAIVTVRAGDATGSATVRVVPPRPVRLVLEPEALLLEIGQRKQVGTTVLAADGEPLDLAVERWSSSDESVARVLGDGTIVAEGAGEAFVYAELGDLRDHLRVTVTYPGLTNDVPYPGPCAADGFTGPGRSTRWREMWTYDERQREVVHERWDDGAPTERVATAWDDHDRRVRRETDRGADGEVDVVETWSYEGERLVTSTREEVGEASRVTTYRYDEAGRLVEEVTPRADRESRVVYTHDAEGRVATREETTTTGDGSLLGRTIYELVYDARGRLAERVETTMARTVEPGFGERMFERVERVLFTYDDADRLIRQRRYRVDEVFDVDILLGRQEFIRDLGGNVVYWQHHFIFESPGPETQRYYTFDCWR